MFWFSFFLWLGTYVLADFFRARLPSVKPAGIGDFDIPTATEGRYIPIMAGRVRVAGPNVTWYGDYEAEERTVKTGVIFRRSETIGYKYRLGLQLTQLRGQVAGMTGVWIGDDKVWDADEHNGGAPSLIVDINRPDLFGGEDQGGGFVGRLRCHNGAVDQAPSTYLANHQNPLPAYRGYTYVMVTNLAEDGGADIGESPSLRDIRIEFQGYDTIANGGLGDTLDLGNDHHIIGKNINPIVFAYDIFTNADWGRGLPPSDINIENFKAAAEQCFDEGLGFSMLQDTVVDAKDLIDIIEQHIDGYIGPNPVTGQIEVILARQDYVLADEFQANADNIVSVRKFSRGEWPQTFNKVLVKYADRTKAYKDTYAVAQDMANRLIQGRTMAKTVSYPGVHDADVANKISWRVIRGLAQPLATTTVELDRTAWQLRPGRVLSLTDEDIGVTNLPMRVLSISLGDPVEGTIVADCVEDVFDAETTGFAAPPPLDFTAAQPVVPLLAVDQAAVEAPYVIMQYDGQPDSIPRLLTLARSSSGGRPNAYDVVRRVRAEFGSGAFGAFEPSEVIRAGFMTVGALRDPLTAWAAGNGSFTVAVDPLAGESLDALIDSYSPGTESAAGIAVIAPGTAEEEWIAFTAVADDAGGVQLQGVWRACCDTGMIPHAAGDRVWFVWTGGLGLPLETYTPGQGVEAKFLPRSPTGVVAEGDATALPEVEMHDPPRHARPLIPRSLLLNGVEFPPSANTDAATSGGGVGVTATARMRLWRVADIVDSIRGFGGGGSPLTDAEIAAENGSLNYWLYNLDATPTPTRADALVSGSVAVTAADQVFEILREDLITAGITAGFNARIEIETSHSPAGEEAGQTSIRPFFFDFSVSGTFGIDEFMSNVVLLLGFNGADASTDIVDESLYEHSVIVNGTAQIDTSDAKFGTGSCLLAVDGDWLEIPHSPDFDFGTGDFTLECFVNVPPAGGHEIASYGSPSVSGWFWAVDGAARFSFGAINGFQIQSSTLVPSNQWVHLAVTRASGVYRAFMDGVEVDNAPGPENLDATTPLRIGFNRAETNSLEGWMDEFRVTKGVARYTANFTPPVVPFPRPWTPAEIATQIWLDANDADTITESGGAVSAWADKSGNGNDFTQPTGSSQPVLTAAVVNGRPVVQFDGSNDHMLNTGSPARSIFSNVQHGWLAAVVKRSATTAKINAIFQSRTASGTGRFAAYSGSNVAGNETGGSLVLRRLDSDSAGVLRSSVDYDDNPVLLFFDADWENGQGRIYTNGGDAESDAIVSAGATSATDSLTAVYLGSEGTSTFSDNGVAEIVIGNQALTEIDRQKLEGYLAHKWGLQANLPVDHPYKDNAP